MRLASLAREIYLHLAVNLPGGDALERARFALGEQTILLEEVVEIRTDVLCFISDKMFSRLGQLGFKLPQ